MVVVHNGLEGFDHLFQRGFYKYVGNGRENKLR